LVILIARRWSEAAAYTSEKMPRPSSVPDGRGGAAEEEEEEEESSRASESNYRRIDARGERKHARRA
jgi:hypothetical protein